MKVLEDIKIKKAGATPAPVTQYKPSKYNHFFKEDGYMLAYNAFSNNFARVTPEKYEIIKQILESPGETISHPEAENLKKDLIKGGFLTDIDTDEWEILKMHNKVGRFQKNFLGLTIAPTLACNFRCVYCFENHKKEHMSKEVQEALIKFAEVHLKHADGLHVDWFGGEPLMAVDIIENLTNALQKLCEESGTRFEPSSIITNGYLLTRQTAERLRSLNIRRAQITLDGPPRVHDLRRPMVNGGGSFHRILENIKNAMDIINIAVRVNIDKENVDSLSEFYEIWNKEGLGRKAAFYFGHVRSDTDACSDVSSQCFSTREFSSLVIDEMKKAREMGFNLASYPTCMRGGYCTADKWNAFIVAPSGLLFKCWEEISMDLEHSIGDICKQNSQPHQVKNLTSYMNWDPYSKTECKSCDIFPICAGGCPYINLKYTVESNCNVWKYYLTDMLRLKYKQLQDNKQHCQPIQQPKQATKATEATQATQATQVK